MLTKDHLADKIVTERTIIRQAVANFNNDIGDFWEWSDESFYPVNLSNEAYKLGVNYVVYAMTH